MRELEEPEARRAAGGPNQFASYDNTGFRRAVIERAAEGICVCHAVPEYPHVRFTIWNERMRALTGYTMEEINQKGWYQAVYPDPEVQSRAQERMERMRQGEDLVAEEWEITRKDGERRAVRISTSLLRTHDDVAHVLALMQDFTEEVRAREALRKVHSELEVRVAQRTAELAEANQRLKQEVSERRQAERQIRATSTTLEAVTRVQQQFLVERDPRQSFDEMLTLLMETTSSEYGFIGEIHRQSDGQPYLKTHAITNVAWNHDTRAFYEHHAPDGLEFYNLDTLFGAAITTQEVVIANDPARDPRAGGLPPGHPPVRAFVGIPFFRGNEIVGMVGLANRPRGYNKKILESLEPLVATCSSLVFAYRLECRRRESEEERHRLERQVLQTQKLESLGLMAGGVAHDFNNLLTGILGYCDLACSELQADSPTRQLIVDAMDAARRAAELTKQLLAYSGQGQFVVQPLNLSALTRDMGHLLETSISKKCVLKFTLMPDLPTILADATQMRQVIMNLVLNASEAIGDEDGVITVSTGVVQPDLESLAGTDLKWRPAEGPCVYLEVADSGCGMSEETRTRIFDPFFTTKFTGRGLGLSAVLGIVRGHRGAVKCHSKPGRGTTFQVLLPATSLPAEVEDKPAAESTEWRGSGTLLVVDDNETVRRLASRMLEAMGFTVLTACDGREGVEMFRSEHESIRLVLLDMTMPRLNGEEALREIRHIRNDVPAILTSGYNEQTITSRFEGKAPAGFIQKPYRFKELMAAVRMALGSEAVQ